MNEQRALSRLSGDLKKQFQNAIAKDRAQALNVMRDRRRRVMELRKNKKHTREEAEAVALELGYQRHFQYWTRAVSFLMRIPEADYKFILAQDVVAAAQAASAEGKKESQTDDTDSALDDFLDSL